MVGEIDINGVVKFSHKIDVDNDPSGFNTISLLVIMLLILQHQHWVIGG
jgi:hypothetical protein